jgi:hypothetical protein
MTERTKTIKGLISGQVDMGTFGLVELELLAIENEMEALRKHDVSSLLKAEREATKEEIREWLRSEDFEGLAERL